MTSDDQLWRAVESRDRRFDGMFVYGVSSTRIFCRPSCPSRRPARERVTFFPTARAAEVGGFRACRRCRPDVAAEMDPQAQRVRAACEAIARRPSASWTIDRLAEVTGGSATQLQRAFKATLGLAPRDFITAARQRRFRDALRSSGRVTDAVYEAGYGSPSRAYDAWKMPGMKPVTYGRGGAGARIGWLTAASPIGRVLVAATGAGLCFVEVGTGDEALVAALRGAFPKAVVDAKPSRHLRPYLDAALAVARAQPAVRDVPLDALGTAFQWRVWRALLTIPRGNTMTYSELAELAGSPRAVRAAARACATNPLALIVPCHRIVGKDGALRGYRWGLSVKARLLDLEAGQDRRPTRQRR